MKTDIECSQKGINFSHRYKLVSITNSARPTYIVTFLFQ